MTAPGAQWQPANRLEEMLLAARQRQSQPEYLSLLAWADLLLPLSLDRPDDPDAITLVEVSGHRCVLAFTSDQATRHVLGADRPRRPVRMVELPRIWPEPDLWLAIDPGLPIEMYLGADAIRALAAESDQPATATEAALAAAASSADPDAFAAALLTEDAVVPISPDADSGSTDIADPDFGWCRMPGDEDLIMVYTSTPRMREQLGLNPYVLVPFAKLLARWPDPATGLAVDPGASFASRLAAPLVAAIADRVRGYADGVMVQTILPPTGEQRYLSGRHNRVAGLVHRCPDGMVPLAELYRQLDLIGEGSPFGVQDPAGYVVRWLEQDKTAYRAPQMTGAELPAGAALWRIDQAGGEVCLARYQLGPDGALGWVSTSPD